VSLDALDEFYAHTPDSLHYVVKDLFEDITLFENRCKEASVKDLGNGKWEVTIQWNVANSKPMHLAKRAMSP
jgi:ABC-2 type transport system permease protein